MATWAGIALLLRFSFPRLRVGIVALLLQGWSGASLDSALFPSTYPTSTTSDMRTPVRQDGSPNSDDSTLRTPNHLSGLSRASFRLTTAASYAFFTWTTVTSYPQGAHSRPRLISQFVTDTPGSIDGRHRKIDPIVAKEITLSKARRTHKNLHAGNRCLHKSVVQGNSILTHSEYGQLFNWIP